MKRPSLKKCIAWIAENRNFSKSNAWEICKWPETQAIAIAFDRTPTEVAVKIENFIAKNNPKL